MRSAKLTATRRNVAARVDLMHTQATSPAKGRRQHGREVKASPSKDGGKEDRTDDFFRY